MPMPFVIRYDRVALAELKGLRGTERASITREIRKQLAREPRTSTGRKKEIVRETGESVWQLRVGEYRIFYDVDEIRREVLVRRVLYKGRQRTEDIL
jgi:mRNA-degrading endonuclease RelE of RelBE toxin-antitoxin system